jgi:CRISPR system Cascade subunit CasE
VLGYRVMRLERGRGKARDIELGVLDLEGTLEVCDPQAFVAALGHGFGRGKAFGCGLMLIRRA